MFMDKENPIPDYFKGKLPASALIGVSGLSDECYLIEFSAIAVVPVD
jgi:enamine deaminase RidA (YjgF/YER057c/UK114 family)